MAGTRKNDPPENMVFLLLAKLQVAMGQVETTWDLRTLVLLANECDGKDGVHLATSYGGNGGFASIWGRWQLEQGFSQCEGALLIADNSPTS